MKFLSITLCLAMVMFMSTDLTKAQSPPSPEDFLGYELGSKYSLTQHLEAYYQKLADESPRVEYQSYGTSVLGRELPFLIVGSEENLRNKEEIKNRLKKLTKR
ncbi:MAG: hypothetical protein R3222_10965, partial [Balneolaceae bacterium]|nr:hypothetical protein [Balneolaceae bacterium]